MPTRATSLLGTPRWASRCNSLRSSCQWKEVPTTKQPSFASLRRAFATYALLNTRRLEASHKVADPLGRRRLHGEAIRASARAGPTAHRDRSPRPEAVGLSPAPRGAAPRPERTTAMRQWIVCRGARLVLQFYVRGPWNGLLMSFKTSRCDIVYCERMYSSRSGWILPVVALQVLRKVTGA